MRYDSRLVRIFDAHVQPVITYTRQASRGFRTLDDHVLNRKIAGMEGEAA